jgi:hypothetical protein
MDARYCHLKGYLFKLGLVISPRSEMYLEKEASATAMQPCDYKAIAYLRFHYTGQYFMEPSDNHGAPLRKVLPFFTGLGLTEG